MRSLSIASLALLTVFALACTRSEAGQAAAPASSPPVVGSAPAPQAESGGSVVVDKRLTIAAPIVFGAVALFPVIDSEIPARPEGDFHLLPEALEARTFTVTEQDSSGSVPTLEVTNSGSKPVLLLAGDVVQGGKQDRIIVADTVVPAGTRDLDIAVNCVEHGRWQQGATGVAFGYGGRGEAGLKKVVQTGKSQSKTWAAVASLNARKGQAIEASEELSPSTGTYMASLKSAGVSARVEPATKALVDGLSARSEVVGVVLSVDGRLVSAEVFGHPSLFAKAREHLVRSFVLDALSEDATDDAEPPPAAMAATFLRDAMTGESVAEETTGATTRTEKKGSRSRGFDLKDTEGKLLHLNAYAETVEEREEAEAEPIQRRGR